MVSPPEYEADDPEALIPDAKWRQSLRRRLVSWFGRNARDLPWRRTSDPYCIWISEVMLQQTQVETVVPYYLRFVERFPDIRSLAMAGEQEVLRLWEGLGYYRRARQLHAASKQLCGEHQGGFPRDLESALALPGVGRYTAGAVLSIAFDQRQPILEGNTLRLYSRLMGYRGDPRSAEGQRLLWRFAEQILPRQHVGTFNQALMELGGAVCRPRNPDCDKCPVMSLCATYAGGWQSVIPAASKQIRYENVQEIAVVVRRNGRVLLRRCEDSERWAGLWDFPRFPVPGGCPADGEIGERVREMTGVRVESQTLMTVIKHGVTRFRITLSCYEAEYRSGRIRQPSTCQWASQADLSGYPLSVTGRKISRLLA